MLMAEVLKSPPRLCGYQSNNSYQQVYRILKKITIENSIEKLLKFNLWQLDVSLSFDKRAATRRGQAHV